MKKIFLFSVILILISGIAYAQSAKEALRGLKKLEAKCQSGISYRDYSSSMGDAKFEVNLFQESKAAGKNQELTNCILRAMGHYINAGIYWDMKFSGHNPTIDSILSKDLEPIILKQYPDADKDAHEGGARLSLGNNNPIMVDFLLPIIWSEASKELNKASKLLVSE
jgi:hypothetical protein